MVAGSNPAGGTEKDQLRAYKLTLIISDRDSPWDFLVGRFCLWLCAVRPMGYRDARKWLGRVVIPVVPELLERTWSAGLLTTGQFASARILIHNWF